MGIQTLDTGVFGGLMMGCIAAYLFNRFFRIQLPEYLGFFSGKRFVPIITSLAAIAIGILMSVIWPSIGTAISTAAMHRQREKCRNHCRNLWRCGARITAV